MKIRLINILAQLMIVDTVKLKTKSVSVHSAKSNKATKKVKTTSKKSSVKYTSSKPIKSKATKVFRNKSNI
jgi:hypothetical protein